MNLERMYKLAGASLLAGSLLACGGGSEGSNLDGLTSALDSDVKASTVAGPLDALQGPLSDQVVAPLADAAAGTPLAPVLSCVDQAVVNDLLDVVDSIALAAQDGAQSGDPAAALQGAAANIQASLEGFATNAVAMLQGLAGGAGCGDDSAGGGAGLPELPGGGTGTPLDAVLEALAGLGDVGGAPGDGGSTPGLSELSAAVTQAVAEFNNAYAMFEQQIPAEALNAPVFGGVLALVNRSVNQLDDVVAAVASGVPLAVGAEVSTLLSIVVNTLLTDVLPINELEDAIGAGSTVGDAIEAGLSQLTDVFAGGLEQLLSALPTDQLPENPLGMGGESPLDTILGQLPSAPGGGGGSPTDALPLDQILAPVLGALGANEPLDALTLVNPLLQGVAPFAVVLTSALSGNGVLGPISGPLLEALGPLSDLLDEAGVNPSLQALVAQALNQALGLLL